MTNQLSHSDLVELTAEIAAAYSGNNVVSQAELPVLLTNIFNSLSGLGQTAPVADKPTPAVPVKKSVFPDYIVCLEDGKKLKMLKRHLNTAYGLSPEDYRERWGLPGDYPMVAPNYAKKRSKLAKKIGLGRKTAEK